jgi:threonine dehydratase
MSPVSAGPVTRDDVVRAAETIRGRVRRTPLLDGSGLAPRLSLKAELFQHGGSFKARGVTNRLAAMSAGERERGVAGASAGNHAIALAWGASAEGLESVVFSWGGASAFKLDRARALGARVDMEAEDPSGAFTRLEEHVERSGATLVHPFDDPLVMAGQGTVGLEILEDAPAVDVVVVPVGGGGLISGISIAAKAINPAIQIYGVQTRAYPSMYDTVKSANLPSAGQTIAEGIAVKDPGKLTREIVRANVHDILLADEAQIEQALAALLEIEKTVVEGAAAAAYAAVLENKQLFHGRKVGIVLSGGNIDMRLLSNVILRELSREGRLLSLEVEIEDRPGLLARVATLVGEAGGNILEVSHNRMMTDMPVKSAYLGMVVEARDQEHADEIRAALTGAGFTLRTTGV